MATSSGHVSPWRYITAFGALVALVYGLVFFTGDGGLTPRLGIDLQGGTRVTLEARTESGAEAPREQLVQAQEIIQTRVDGLGVSGAEVVLDGSNIVITVPGEDGDQARTLGQTAELRFREVIGQPIAAAPPVDPAAPAPESVVPQSPAPAETPQGAGPVIATPVAPVAQTSPLDTPTPTPAPEPAAPAPDATATDAPADPAAAAAIEEARATWQSTDPVVQQQALLDLDCSAVDPLRGYDDPSLPLVACNQEGTAKYLLSPNITDSQGNVLEGTMIAGAQSQPAPGGIGTDVSLSWTSEGAAIWGDYTSNNVGALAAFVLDGEVVSAPQVNGPIYGDTQISGDFTPEEAAELAGVLRYGALPLSFTSSEAQTVSATLGIASLQAGLIAIGIGLVVVLVYCLAYYRVLGLFIALSVVLGAVIIYGALVLLGRWIGFAVDLPGMAGFVIAIGIAADSFVLFFERLKDEVRSGRTFRSSVPRAWARTRQTVLVANAVTFLAAVVLYVLAAGQVKGFAFTLGLATVLDLIVVFMATHPLVEVMSGSKLFNKPAFSGVGEIGKKRVPVASATGGSA